MYTLKHRNVPWSRFDYPHLIVERVPGRDLILYHAGNYYTDIEGCKLPGFSFKDINDDGLIDVLDSKPALDTLVGSVPEEGERYKVEWREDRRLDAAELEEVATVGLTDILKDVSLA